MTEPPRSTSRPAVKRPIGAYVPPAKRVKAEKFDPGTEEHQRLNWSENKLKLRGLMNRADAKNVTIIIKELFNCNLIRYKGLFASALIEAQQKSTAFTDSYAAIVAVINSRLKTVGALVVKRILVEYKLSFRYENKPKCLATVKLIAHLINQEVIHDDLGFQILDDLLDKPDQFSVEVAISFIKECGSKLDQIRPTRLFRVFETFRNLSYREGEFDTRTNVMIDEVHDMRRLEFRDNPPLRPELDILDEDDRVTHEFSLKDLSKDDRQLELDRFKFDPKWSLNESKYEDFKSSLLEDNDQGDSSCGDDDDDSDDVLSSDSDQVESNGNSASTQRDKREVKAKSETDKKDPKLTERIIDSTGKDLVAFRRNVFLTIKSSINHEEVVHKLLKSGIESEYHDELCQIILDCCGEERTFMPIYARVAAKLCQISRRDFPPNFEKIFELFYQTVDNFETNKIRSVARFYGHLLATETIDWQCLSCIKLTEETTSSPGRCFIMFLFQELVSLLKAEGLLRHIKDPMKHNAFKHLFYSEEEQHIRYAITFFTASGLGQLTDDLKEALKRVVQQ